MIDFNAQIQQMFQPSSQLLTANAKVLETALAQQSSLVSSFISSSLEFNKQLLEQKDFSNIQKISEQFGKTITDQMTSSKKEIVATITEASEQSSEIIKGFVDQTQQNLKQQANK